MDVWNAVHAGQHAPWTTKRALPAPVSQDVTIDVMDTGVPGAVILLSVVDLMEPSSDSTEDSITRLSHTASVVCACCSSTLQDRASHTPRLGGDPPYGIARSLVTAILATNHTLLV